jgi:hypothetical protein
MLRVTELNSIRIITHSVQIREENLYHLLMLLFSLFLILICRSDLVSCCMVIGNAMANVDSAMPSLARPDSDVTPRPSRLGSTGRTK